MGFIWDLSNTTHIERHAVTPDEAEQVIQNNSLEIGTEERNGELRVLHLGETDSGRILLVAVTARDQEIRVVTAYPAKKKVRNFYEKQKAISHEENTPDP